MKHRSFSSYTTASVVYYDETDSLSSPIVRVSGNELKADTLVRIAKRYGIPVIEEPLLAKSLSAMKRDTPIPRRLYEAMAFVIARLKSLS